jgi:ubiquinone/menaquinone biosynthesis C-methylase UbiE
MQTTNDNSTVVPMATLKERLRKTWMAGNYDYFSRYMEPSARQLLAPLSIKRGTRVLDVACGSGQLALVAARMGAKVTGVDIAPNLIDAARGRAEADALPASFDVGDAEALPYTDTSFDIVATLFGAMFAPQPDLVASELARVCRPGGSIAMANWTRDGFIGQMFRTFARFIAPTGMPAPVLWGDEDTVRQRLGQYTSSLSLRRVYYAFDYPFGPAAVVELFRENYGPTVTAFASLGQSDQRELEKSLVELWSSHNQATRPDRTLIPSEYLEVIAVRA